MQSTTITVSKFFSKYDKLYVPIYQRDFTWSKKNIKIFFDDITFHLNFNYFIGSFIIHDNENILDGQQRLTTILLFLKVLSKSPNFKLIQKKNHSNILDAVFNIIPENNTNLYKMSCFIKQIISDSNINEDKLFNIIENLNLTLNLLDEHDNIHNIFESQNNSGIPLNQIDLIRNWIILNLNNDIILIEKYISSFDSGNHTIKDLLLFFETYIVFNNSKTCIKSEIYNEFKSLFFRKNISISDFLDDVINYFTLYKCLTTTTEFNVVFFRKTDLHNNIKERLHILNKLGHKEIYYFLLPLIKKLFLYNNKNINNYKSNEDKIFFNILDFLINYLLRRSIYIHNSTGALGHIFSDCFHLLSIFDKNNVDFDVLFINYLHSLTLDSRKIPSDEQIKFCFLNKDFYFSTKHKNLFIILNFINSSNSNQSVLLLNSQNYSIEHLIPQSYIDQEWFINLNDSIKNTIIQDNIIGKIGNLTLVKKNTNSTLKNKSISKKLIIIKEDPDTNSIPLNKILIDDLEENPDFLYEKKYIDLRSLNLFELFIHRFPSNTHLVSNELKLKFTKKLFYFDELNSSDLLKVGFFKGKKIKSISIYGFGIIENQNTLILFFERAYNLIFQNLTNYNLAKNIHNKIFFKSTQSQSAINSNKKLKKLDDFNLFIFYGRSQQDYLRDLIKLLDEIHEDTENLFSNSFIDFF
jgi:hypothetical protein